jgi:RNA polymerase sigma factor (sigma-70 family)
MTEEVPQLVDHLFRREAGKMVSYLTKVFGMGNLALAEDVVQETLVKALETWPFHGLPDNPSAWLMRVARNRAIDLIRREAHFKYIAPDLAYLFKLQEEGSAPGPQREKEIQDDQLRMMFSCCHPDLSADAQVTLILKTLCGFSVSEIAHAFFTQEDAIEKKLGRTRKALRESGTFVELTDNLDIPQRLETVYQALYLIFNEGYHGSRSDRKEPEEFCYEAMRLALLLAEHPEGQRPKTYALLALMCLHAARLPGRMGDDGTLIQLEFQDRSKWDQALIGKGLEYLERAWAGQTVSEYLVEASIAGLHCSAKSYVETEWAKILELYDLLYHLKPTPVVALNQAIALGKAEGLEKGLEALKNLPGADKLKEYPFYPAALGEFHLLAGRLKEAGAYFAEAVKQSRNKSEKLFFERKLKACQD